MDINLPLILFIAVAASGVIWLYDILFLAKARNEGIATVEGQFENLPDNQKLENTAYKKAMEAASEEPVAVEYAKSFFPILALVFVLRSFIIEPFQIPSESMLPTLEVGDFIVVNKFTYGIRLPIIRTKVLDINDPKRGDVMVFFPPHESRYFIKRVIGLPGDKVKYLNHQLYINDKLIEQEFVESVSERNDRTHRAVSYKIQHETIDDKQFVTRKSAVSKKNQQEFIVPDGHYFMMGDNRDNSQDSRFWGTVPEERIVGKAFAIWMHWDSFFSIPSFSRVGSIQ